MKNMKKQILLILFLYFLCCMEGIAQQQIGSILTDMSYDVNSVAEQVDSTSHYTIGNYMLYPGKKLICVGRMFGTKTKDCFGYFPDSTLVYDKETMVIFGGSVFFNDHDLDIDWKSVQLLWHRENYVEFTDGDFLYYLDGGNVHKNGKYNKDTYRLRIAKEPPKKSTKRIELVESFYVENGKFYLSYFPVLENFEVPNLHTIVSKSGYKTNFVSDGKQVVFCGGTGIRIKTKDNKEYATIKDIILEGVDIPSLQVLGKDLLADKNAIYFRNNIIPFEKLNGFKLIIRELE